MRLYLSAPATLRYDWDTDSLYVDDGGTIYCYHNIQPTYWSIIKGGDMDFLDRLTEVMPYQIVSRIPKGSNVEYYAPQVPSVVMWRVNSSNVSYMGYDGSTSRLYVQFKNGDTYVYYDVEPQLWNGLRQADSKSSYLHWFIKVNDYRYDKIGGFLLTYSTNYMSPNSGTAHPDGYLVVK